MASHVLALHAAGTTPEMWDDVRAELGSESLHAPDLNGMAEETGGELETLVARLCATVPDGELLVTGCSLGANLAVHVARALGERVRGLLLLSPPPVIPDEHFLEGARNLRESSVLWTHEQLVGMVPILLYPGNPRFERAARILERMLMFATGPISVPLLKLGERLPAAAQVLSHVRCDVRALFGARAVNPLYGPDLLPGWRGALGDGRVMVIEDSADLSPLERPELIAALLRQMGLR